MKTSKKANAYRTAALPLAHALMTGYVHAVFTGRKVAFYTVNGNDPGGPLICVAWNLPISSPWVGSNWDMQAKFTAACILAWLTDAEKVKHGVEDGENWAAMTVVVLD